MYGKVDVIIGLFLSRWYASLALESSWEKPLRNSCHQATNFFFQDSKLFSRPYFFYGAKELVQQISVKSGVSTAHYDKSIKLGTLIQDIMRNISKIRGNRDMLCVSQGRAVKVVGVIIQNGRRQRYFIGVETYSIIV